MRQVSSISAFIFLVTGFLFCTDDYNPFSIENASLHIYEKSFSDNDSISIFSTETLQVIVSVREKVDSFTIHAKENRYWTDTTIRKLHTPEIHTFTFSFRDVGNQKIKINTYRSNGDILTDTFQLYTYTPLNPNNLGNVHFGKKINLKTNPVKDKDILYKWRLGDFEIVSSKADTSVLFHQNNLSNIGKLWVYDYRREIYSPVFEFSYNFVDSLPPSITLATEGFEDKDTIRVSEDVFAITFKITDQQLRLVDFAEINEDTFDIINPRNNTYTKIIRNIKKRNSVPLEVRAIDNKINNNDTTRVYTILYDSSAGKAKTTKIRYGTLESTDTIFVFQRENNIFGFVEDHIHSTVSVSAEINGKKFKDTISVDPKNGEGKWSWQKVQLSKKENLNPLKVSCYDSLGKLLAERTFYLVYDPNGKDETPPVIYSISFDGVSGGKNLFYTQKDTLLLKITAFDEGSGIKSFLVDGLLIEPSLSNNYLWEVSIPLFDANYGFLYDEDKGKPVNLKAMDKWGNTDDSLIILFNNHPPTFQRNSNLPWIIKADTTYIDTLRCISDDSDSVFFQCIHKPATMKIRLIERNQWEIQWKPSIADTGKDSLTGYLDDSKQKSELLKSSFFVIDPKLVLNPVKLKTKKNQLPNFLEANYDTFSLKAEVESGIDPIQYALQIRNRKKIIADTIFSNSFLWLPEVKDTGEAEIQLIANDYLKTSDTLLKNIRIVEPNRPCSVYVFGVNEDGIDLREMPDYDTLDIIISDPDSTYLGSAEWFTVCIKHLGNEMTVVLNESMETQYILSPLNKQVSMDTLSIIVHDRRMHRDTITFPVYYKPQPPKPENLRPRNNSSITDTTVTFSWQNKTKNDYSFSLYFLDDDKCDTLATNISDTTFTLDDINKSGHYKWYVSMGDSENVYFSDTMHLMLQNPGHVRFKTKEDAFPIRMHSAKDSFSVLLEVQSSSKHPPFRFSAFFKETNEPILENSDNNLVKFRSPDNYAGYLHGIITVTDSNENSDTLFPLIEVIAQDTTEFDVSLEIKGLHVQDSIIAMTSFENDSLLCRITDHTSKATVQYTYYVEQNGLRIVDNTEVTEKDSFYVRLGNNSNKKGYEELNITVCKNDNRCETVSTTLYYGENEIRGPFDINEGIQVWLRADTGIIRDDENGIKYWYDFSGNYNNAKGMSKNEYLPQLVSSLESMNSKPAVSFDDVNSNWIRFENIGVNTSADNFSIFIVLEPTGTSSTIISNEESFNLNQTDFFYNGNESVNINLSEKSVISILQNTDSVFLYENGLFEALPIQTENIAGFDSSLSIGKPSTTDNDYFNGYISEIIIYNRFLTWQEKATIEKHLMEKYSILSSEEGTKRISVNPSYGIDSAIYAVPVLVRLNEHSFTFSDAGTHGEGLRFSNSARNIFYPYEISRWDAVAKEADIWVNFPEIIAGAQFDVFVDTDDMKSLSQPSEVFPYSQKFVSVLHLDTTIHEFSNYVTLDATNQKNDGYILSSNIAEGIITNCLLFKDSSDILTIPNNAYPLVPNTDFTISTWVSLSNNDKPRYPIIAAKGQVIPLFFIDHVSPDDETDGDVYSDSGYTLASYIEPEDRIIRSDTIFQKDTLWHHIAMVYSSLEEEIVFFHNGKKFGNTISDIPFHGSVDFDIIAGGTITDSLEQSCFFEGKIDELRIEHVQRSEEWFKFVYENQKMESELIIVE